MYEVPEHIERNLASMIFRAHFVEALILGPCDSLRLAVNGSSAPAQRRFEGDRFVLSTTAWFEQDPSAPSHGIHILWGEGRSFPCPDTVVPPIQPTDEFRLSLFFDGLVSPA